MSATSSGRICEWQSAIGYAAVTFDHIALSDATEAVVRHSQYGFDWTRFSLHIRSARKLTLNETPLVTVIGKAFWDVGHAAVNAMLLSEFLKAHRKVQEQEATIVRLTSTDAITSSDVSTYFQHG